MGNPNRDIVRWVVGTGIGSLIALGLEIWVYHDGTSVAATLSVFAVVVLAGWIRIRWRQRARD